MADLPIKVDTKGGPRGRTAGPMEVANRAVDPAEAEKIGRASCRERV